MKEALDHISKHIKEYRETDLNNGDALNEHLQQITATLYYLETIRSKVHDDWQKTVFRLIAAGDTVSRAENSAHVQHPEMYLLRRVMDAGYRTCDAIRSNVSWLKSERNASN